MNGDVIIIFVIRNFLLNYCLCGKKLYYYSFRNQLKT